MICSTTTLSRVRKAARLAKASQRPNSAGVRVEEPGVRTLPLGSVSFENKIERERRKADLARPHRPRPSEGHARAGRELRQCHLPAGGLKPGTPLRRP
jgi:hypothetical protein